MEKEVKTHSSKFDTLALVGISLILLGAFLFIDSQFSINLVLYVLLTLMGLAGLIVSINKKNFLLAMGSVFLSGSGFAFFFGFSNLLKFEGGIRAGLAFLSFGLSWLAIFLINRVFFHKLFLWLLLPGFTISLFGLTLALDRNSFLEIMFAVAGGLSLSMLVWGYVNRWIGLLIPACLLGSSSLGIYLAWRPASDKLSSLASVGVMLVIFAIGWVLITVFSRRVTQSFLWWPLIPAAVIGVTGWGLYIGGNPSGAGRFIGNTGSITLMIFGLYVLLLRRGFQK